MPWALRGLRNGVVTTGYPRRTDSYAETFLATVQPLTDSPVDVSLCPTGAIRSTDGVVWVDTGQCILCGRCVRERPDLFGWVLGSETARLHRDALIVPRLPETDEAVECVRRDLAARTAMLRRSVHALAAAALVVAIPATFGYNIFAGRLNRFDGMMESFGTATIALLVREGQI